MQEVALLRFLQIVHDGAGSADGQGQILEAEPLERLRLEVLNENIAAVVLAEHPVVLGGRQTAECVAQKLGDRIPVAPLQDQLGRMKGADLFGQLLQRELARFELSRGGVDIREADRLTRRRDCGWKHDGGQEVVLLLVQDAVGECHAGRHDFDDIALHDPLREPRILELFADGNPVSRFEEFGEVRFQRVVRKAGQGNLAGGAVPAPGERDAQDARGRDGIILECLEEVPHPEQQDGIRIARLDLRVLLHEGG